MFIDLELNFLSIKVIYQFLESFKIMDYSFLLGIHNVDQAKKNESEVSYFIGNH